MSFIGRPVKLCGERSPSYVREVLREVKKVLAAA
jgi:hypothetical protein